MIQELDQDNLSEIITENSKVVVQYSASWCRNCRIMKPKFKKMARENTEAVFVIVDAEKFPKSRKMANVNNLPTFATFVGGNFLRQVQTNKPDVLQELVSEI